MIEPTVSTEVPAHLELTPEEREVLITALKLLRSTLGREEADELAEVQALIARLGG